MATIKEVYKLLKQKKASGEKIGMFGGIFYWGIWGRKGNFEYKRSSRFIC